MSTNIPIRQYEIKLMAHSMHIQIHEFQFGKHITLKILLFDSDNNYIISYYLPIEGNDYDNMISSSNSDEFIKMYIANILGIYII